MTKENAEVVETDEPEITSENYYEIQERYFSYSQYKGFRECEARELAKIRREHVEEASAAMILGSYFHAAFESPEIFEQFQEENSEKLFKRNGEKTAEVLKIDAMIETITNDEYALSFLQGDKEQVYTGNLYGYPFKIKVDNVNHFEEFFSDLKSARGFYEKYWHDEERRYVSFIEKFDYILQAAIYQEIIMQNVGIAYKPYIVAATKETTPDKAVFHIEQWRMEEALERLPDRLRRYQLIKEDLVMPNRCGRCDYCKATKQITQTIEVGELIV